MSKLFGGIEAGGTKFICAVAGADCEPIATSRIPTTDPEQTMAAVIEFFQPYATQLAGIGIGCFGPIERDPTADEFGAITTTPKLAWRHFNIVKAIRDEIDVAILFDTDVNAAAIGEYYFGAGRELQNFVYLTVGTGVGGALLIKGEPYHGTMHLELGHVLIPHNKLDSYRGCCPAHANCLEGLASGTALVDRWRIDDITLLPQHDDALNLEAEYLAAALVNYTCCLSPQRIILGGGVMQCHQLLPLIRASFIEQLAGYVCNAAVAAEDYIQIAGLEQNAGIKGALAMIKRGLQK